MPQTQDSLCMHRLRSLVLLLCLWIDACLPDQTLFLFLHETAAWAAARAQAVHETVAFNTILLAHTVSLNGLEDALRSTVCEA